MNRSCSVAEARARLPGLLRRVEQGDSVAITRRGRPVAVLVPVPAFRAISGRAGPFLAAYGAWRATVDPRDLALPRNHFRRLRDSSPGRPAKL